MRPGRKCNEYTIWERLYLIGSLLGLLVGLGFAVYGIIRDHFQSGDSSYLFVFAVNCCFAIIYTIKGMKHEDPYDILTIVLSVAPIVIYIIIDYINARNNSFKEVRLFIGLGFAFFIGAFGIYYLCKFWKSKNFITRHGVKLSSSRRSIVHRRAGSQQEDEPSMEKLLRTMLQFYLLLSINLQCDMSAAVFTLTSGYSVQIESGHFLHKDMFILFFAVIIIAVVAWMLGHFSVKKESKKCVVIFGVLSVLLVAAGMYLLVQASEDVNKTDTHETLCRVTLFIAVLMVFLRIVTCLACYMAYQNFGKGLKQRVYGRNDDERGLIESQWKNQLYTSSINEDS